MSIYLWLAAGAIVIAAVTWAAVGALRPWLARHGVVDIPNERSSHREPRVRGVGLAIVAVLVPAWLIWLLAAGAPPAAAAVPAVVAGLAWISWRDDVAGLGQWPRLAAHLAAAALLTWSLPGPVFQGLLPPAADAVVTALLLVWFINLYNFMDGIDGITGVETIAVNAGLAIAFITAGTSDFAWPATISAAAAAGFLVWNWSPARVFMGDVGSIPLGAVTGWLLLIAASNGQWAAAMILPAYYLADATITLARRAIRGANVLQAHREHFYQRAVRSGRGHATVSRAIAVANVGLVAAAVASVCLPAWAGVVAIVFAAAIVAVLLVWLAHPQPVK